jgi:cyanate permease
MRYKGWACTIYMYVCICVCVCVYIYIYVGCIDQPRNDNLLPGLQLAAHSDQNKNQCLSVLWNGLWSWKAILYVGLSWNRICYGSAVALLPKYRTDPRSGRLILGCYSCSTYCRLREGKMQHVWVKRSPHLRHLSLSLSIYLYVYDCLFLHCHWHWKYWRHKLQRPMQKLTSYLPLGAESFLRS